jgi:predicted ATPase/DNA-binding CsgD family transcriptional regulator
MQREQTQQRVDMKQRCPTIREGKLHLPEGAEGRAGVICLGTAAWHRWLTDNSAFIFEMSHAHYSARKERRSGGWYWYAYRRRHGKLHTAYIGKSEELTLGRLCDVAAAFADDLSAPSTQRPSDPYADIDVEIAAPLPLPIPLTPLVGREDDAAAVAVLLQRPEVRLVSLTGMGGVGKTRLALEVASRLRHFSGGVYFLALAPLRDPQMVPGSIAQLFGLKERPGTSIVDLLSRAIGQKEVLLVLDNFEHLMPAASLLVDLLTACPTLKILAASREILHLRGEYHFPVAPLAFPDPAALPSFSALYSYPSVSLFLQRAQAIVPNMAVNPATLLAIASVCARLEGLPLAIELAAARVRLLPPQAMATRLGRRLDVLTQGGPDLPDRHRTLRATFTWSRDLLTEAEQRLFRRLAVFIGGCTLDAAEAVCAIEEAYAAREAGEGGPAEPMPFLDLVASLIDKSLLQTEQVYVQGGSQRNLPGPSREAADGHERGPRLYLLETVREYALECLRESGEEERVQAAHADYFLRLAEESHASRTQGLAAHSGAGAGGATWQWSERLSADNENLRAAVNFFLSSHDKGCAQRMIDALAWHWEKGGRAAEGPDWSEVTRPVEECPSQENSPCVVARPAGLTRREMEALLLVAEGLHNDEIADRLVVSTATVKTYLSAIYSKLGVSSRTGAMRFAMLHGLPTVESWADTRSRS